MGKFNADKISNAIGDISDVVDAAKPLIAGMSGSQTGTITGTSPAGYQPPNGLPFQPNRAVAGSYRDPGQVPGTTDLAKTTTGGGAMPMTLASAVEYAKENPGKVAVGGALAVALAAALAKKAMK